MRKQANEKVESTEKYFDSMKELELEYFPRSANGLLPVDRLLNADYLLAQALSVSAQTQPNH